MHLHHLAFRTRDVERLLRFYRDVLGLTVARDNRPRSVWLRSGDAVVMLEQADAAEPAPPAGTLELVAFRVTDLAPHVARLAAAGVAIEATTEHTRYFRDPDGRRLALSTYPL